MDFIAFGGRRLGQKDYHFFSISPLFISTFLFVLCPPRPWITRPAASPQTGQAECLPKHHCMSIGIPKRSETRNSNVLLLSLCRGWPAQRPGRSQLAGPSRALSQATAIHFYSSYFPHFRNCWLSGCMPRFPSGPARTQFIFIIPFM